MPRKAWIFLAIAPITIWFDQLTKRWVIDGFRYGESLPVIDGIFNLTYVRNTGAAFGMLASADPSFRVPFFLIVPVLALVAIGYIFKKIPSGSIFLSIALALVVGGAVGNLIDRVQFGYVVDFLDFHWMGRAHFPAFNVADSAICVGVGLLMIDMLKSPKAPVRVKQTNVSPSL